MPCLRRWSTAASSLPLQASRAFLQSIIGAPVRSRSLRTCSAVMVGFLPSFPPGAAVVVIAPSVFIRVTPLDKASPRRVFLRGEIEFLPSVLYPLLETSDARRQRPRPVSPLEFPPGSRLRLLCAPGRPGPSPYPALLLPPGPRTSGP